MLFRSYGVCGVCGMCSVYVVCVVCVVYVVCVCTRCVCDVFIFLSLFTHRYCYCSVLTRRLVETCHISFPHSPPPSTAGSHQVSEPHSPCSQKPLTHCAAGMVSHQILTSAQHLIWVLILLHRDAHLVLSEVLLF